MSQHGEDKETGLGSSSFGSTESGTGAAGSAGAGSSGLGSSTGSSSDFAAGSSGSLGGFSGTGSTGSANAGSGLPGASFDSGSAGGTGASAAPYGVSSGSDIGGPEESSSGLMEVLERMGVSQSQLSTVRESLKDMNIEESLERARSYVNESLTKARDYARRNPGVVLGGLAAVVVSAGILAATLRRGDSRDESSLRLDRGDDLYPNRDQVRLDRGDVRGEVRNDPRSTR